MPDLGVKNGCHLDLALAEFSIMISYMNSLCLILLGLSIIYFSLLLPLLRGTSRTHLWAQSSVSPIEFGHHIEFLKLV